MAGSDACGMKIGEVAAFLEVTPRTIRFYEDEGLLSVRRSRGGTRYYRESDVQRLRAILALAAAGAPLDRIKALARERERHATGNRASQAVEGCLQTLEAECRTRLEALENAVAALNAAAALVGQCRGCRRQPDSTHCPDCPVKRARTSEPMASLIWDQHD